MQRRSFFRKLFGAVVGGLAAPRLGAAAAEPIVVIDPAAPYAFQFTGFKQAGAFPELPSFNGYSIEGGFYTPGKTFKITGRRFEIPIAYRQ